MDIRDFLAEVGATYKKTLGIKKGVHAQDLLRVAPEHFTPHVPPGWVVTGNGGMGTASWTPWVGVLSPSVTLDPKKGLYIAYIFAKDLKSVTLVLNQGITELHNRLKSGAREVLRAEAERLVSEVPALQDKRLRERMDLASSDYRQKAYVAGAVAAIRYSLPNLPPEAGLRAELWRMTELLDIAALNQANYLRATASPRERRDFAAAQRIAAAGDPLERFKPKDASDYEAQIVGRKLVKRREHEALILQFGEYIRERGFRPNTNVHPRDLTLGRDGDEWLVEAKAIYTGNATQAIREATGQLLTYRHFLYLAKERQVPHLVGLFTESIGAGYVEFLETIGIGSVWRTPSGWEGSPLASGWELF